MGDNEGIFDGLSVGELVGKATASIQSPVEATGCLHKGKVNVVSQ